MSAQVKPWLVLAVIFIAGVLTGVGLTIGFGPHFEHPPDPAQFRAHLIAHYVRDLNITADQQAKIEPVLNDMFTKLQAVRKDEFEKASQIFKAADDQIEPLLTPDQKAALAKLEAERQKTFLSHGHAHGPDGEPRFGPGGPPPDDHGGASPPAPPMPATNASAH